jgi:putative DNA primase/helicase
LTKTTGGDEELASFLQRAVGYSLTGLTTEEKLFFAHGPAATGKSTFLEAIRTVIGDYGRTADFQTFVKRTGDRGIPNDIARLVGARLVVGSEVDEGKQLAEALVKQLTGGDTVTARFMRQEFFEYTPQFKLWLAANARPAVDPNDSGIWRRILLIPFTQEIPEEERDPTVKERLRTDPDVHAAVLAWAARGCLLWQQRGLDPPPSVVAYTDEYREETDPLSEFFNECCDLNPLAWVASRSLHESYHRWAKFHAHAPVSSRTLAASLKRRNVEQKKRKGERGWQGIRLSKASPEHYAPASHAF